MYFLSILLLIFLSSSSQRMNVHKCCIILQVLLKAVVVFSWPRQLPNPGQSVVLSYPAWMIKPVGPNSRNQANLLWDLSFFFWEFYSRSLIWHQMFWCSDCSSVQYASYIHLGCMELTLLIWTWDFRLFAFVVNSLPKIFYNVVYVNIHACCCIKKCVCCV